eukprot:TRINITY_DN2106_c0_g1_i1.p1 TRINITY_DN2106_c0_g1~~TRINITY_DN2106_c0_g1_i1.p1  ORF type:complete len:406 (-),score=128.94 TRINITY_DN2106_c0_g1_i1:83-1300(-)
MVGDSSSSSSSSSWLNGTSSAGDALPAPFPPWPPRVSAVIMLVLFVLCWVPALSLVALHLIHYVQPSVQRFFLRMLLLAPLFELFALLSFGWEPAAPWVGIAEDLYEPYTLLVFYSLLVSFVGGPSCLCTCLKDRIAPRVKLFCCIKINTPKPDRLVQVARIAVFQFMIVKPLCGVTGAVCLLLFPNRFIDLGLRLTGLASLMVAMWTLLVFFRAVSRCLEGLDAVKIFLWLKGLIFLLLVQSVVIDMGAQREFFQAKGDVSALFRARRFDAFLVAFEMTVFSWFAFFIFNYRPFANAQRRGQVDKCLNGRITTGFLVRYGVLDVLKLWDLKGKGCPHPQAMDTFTAAAAASPTPPELESPPAEDSPAVAEQGQDDTEGAVLTAGDHTSGTSDETAAVRANTDEV